MQITFQTDSYQGIMSQPTKVKGKPTFKVEKQAELYKDLIKNKKKQSKMTKFLKQKKQNEAQSRKEIKVSCYYFFLKW